MANAQFTCTLHAWREGNVLKAYMEYRRTDGATYLYQDTNLPAPTMDLGGGGTYTDTTFQSAVVNGVYINPALVSQTFSRTVSGTGNRVVTWTCGSGLRSDFQGTWQQTVYFPTTDTPPSGGSITNVSATTNTITATIGITDWGNGTSNYMKRLAVMQPPDVMTNPPIPQYAAEDTTNSMSATLTVTNNSTTYNTPAFTINPNTSYNLGLFASTNKGEYRFDYASNPVVTLPEAATLATVSAVGDTATVSYSTNADGGYYNKTIEYSLDSGATWNTGIVVSGGSAATGSFYVTGLTPSVANTVQTRITTAAGSTACTTLTITPNAAIAFYGSAGGQSVKIKKFYASVGGQTKRIKKLYGSVGGLTKLVFEDPNA